MRSFANRREHTHLSVTSVWIIQASDTGQRLGGDWVQIDHYMLWEETNMDQSPMFIHAPSIV